MSDMPLDSKTPPWWNELPMANPHHPSDNDLCHFCGIARFRHLQTPWVAGCPRGKKDGAPYHVAGLPKDYRYDKIMDPKVLKPNEGPWWIVPNSYLRKYGML